MLEKLIPLRPQDDRRRGVLFEGTFDAPGKAPGQVDPLGLIGKAQGIREIVGSYESDDDDEEQYFGVVHIFCKNLTVLKQTELVLIYFNFYNNVLFIVCLNPFTDSVIFAKTLKFGTLLINIKYLICRFRKHLFIECSTKNKFDKR